MNTVLITIISVPIIEIYLFIKIGGQIGAFNTISLIFITAIIGVIYARYEGLNTLKSGFSQLVKNELPAYEIISGAAIALFFGILLVAIGLTVCLGPSCGDWTWNIIFIALGIPVSAGSVMLIWKRSDKKAMVQGAKTIFIIGCMVAVGVIIWFITVLNSLGG